MIKKCYMYNIINMSFNINDRVRMENGKEGVVNRLRVLNVQKSARILLDDGSQATVFGKKFDKMEKI